MCCDNRKVPLLNDHKRRAFMNLDNNYIESFVYNAFYKNINNLQKNCYRLESATK